jgi:chromosomal replication initiator protein
VLLASSRPGPHLRQIVPALAARLGAGEAFELTAPGWETRVAIVLDRVRAWDARATPDVAAQLATSLRSDLERLDAVLTRLMAESGAATGLEDPALVQQILEGGSATHRPPSPEQVIELVARHFGVRLRELRSSSRAARTSTPRQIAIYLLRRHCGLSYPEVGRHFQRHHTTALHSDRLVQRQLESDPGLRATLVLLEKELRSAAERGR